MTEITTYLSPGGQQVTHGGGPATRILVGTIKGVATLRRAAAGAPWALEGRSLEHRHVGSLVYEAGSGKLFAGARLCHRGVASRFQVGGGGYPSLRDDAGKLPLAARAGCKLGLGFPA